MSIDWLTVGAQVVNFLVLVWLLKRFLYGPILRAMRAREARIEARTREAREARATAVTEAEALREERADLERRREAFLDEARREAETLGERLRAEAREAAEAARRDWRRRIEDEREAFLVELRRRTARHVHETARAALGALADASLEERVAERFIDRLDALEGEWLDELRRAAAGPGARVHIESALDPAEPVRRRLVEAVRARIAEHAEVEFRRDEALLLGLRLGIGGRVVEWSLSDHLDRLQSAVDEALLEGRAAKTRQAA